MKLLLAVAFGATFVFAPMISLTAAKACTNSYDTARDGSNCGGRASGCKAGGRGGNC